MIRFLAFSGILFFCLSSALARAEQSSLMTVLDLTEVERGYIALDYAYFSESLDVFDFASKLNSTFKPKDAASTFGSIGYKPSSNLLISYQREATSAATTRDREPFEVESDVQGDALLVQWRVGERLGYDVQLLAGLAARKQSDLTVACYAYTGLTVGACEGADLSFTNQETGEAEPAVITAAEEDRWQLGLLLKKQYGNGVSLWHRLRYVYSEVDTDTRSAFLDLNDPFLLGIQYNGETLGTTISRLKATFPQEAPWSEAALRYDFGLNVSVGERWLLTGEVGLIKVSRRGYEQYEGVPNYESNALLNASIWYNPIGDLAFYGRAELSQHYLLGLDPMVYNQRTAKFFEHPYAQISAGLLYTF